MLGITTIAWTGGTGGKLAGLADYPFIVPSPVTARISRESYYAWPCAMRACRGTAPWRRALTEAYFSAFASINSAD